MKILKLVQVHQRKMTDNTRAGAMAADDSEDNK